MKMCGREMTQMFKHLSYTHETKIQGSTIHIAAEWG